VKIKIDNPEKLRNWQHWIHMTTKKKPQKMCWTPLYANKHK